MKDLAQGVSTKNQFQLCWQNTKGGWSCATSLRFRDFSLAWAQVEDKSSIGMHAL